AVTIALGYAVDREAERIVHACAGAHAQHLSRLWSRWQSRRLVATFHQIFWGASRERARIVPARDSRMARRELPGRRARRRADSVGLEQSRARARCGAVARADGRPWLDRADLAARVRRR